MTTGLLNIGDIEKFSIVDFPSKMAVVVFMQGCPWRCPFCYNQTLQNPHIEGDAEWDNLIHLLEHRKGIIDAVVFSGGEPLMQKEALIELCGMLRDFDIAVYTGHPIEDVPEELLQKIKYIKTGPFIKELRTTVKSYVGSENQEFRRVDHETEMQ